MAGQVEDKFPRESGEFKRSQVMRNGGMVSATAIMNESAPKTKGTKAKNSVDMVKCLKDVRYTDIIKALNLLKID